jgi:DNA-directed RNA polymerase subunit RPC12/RpoP
MTRQIHEEDEFEEDWDDADFDSSTDEDDPAIPCPYCGWQIPEDTPRCPYCENYLSEEDAPPSRKPVWIVVGTLACLYIIYRWIAR